MKKCNWQAVDAASNDGAGRLPAGGYVARITNVEDVPSKQYLWVEYDIAEGDYAGYYANVTDRPYLHRFVKGYGDNAMPFFKQFLEALQFSNPGRFDWARWMERSDESEFIGLEIGIVVQDEQYTNTKGIDKTRQNVVGVYATQDIRNGEFKVPEPTDKREKVASIAAKLSSAKAEAERLDERARILHDRWQEALGACDANALAVAMLDHDLEAHQASTAMTAGAYDDVPF